jgi:hypothetical protein
VLKREIKWEDFDGAEQSGVFWFHLKKNTLVQMLITAKGENLVDELQDMVDAKDKASLLIAFRDIVGKSYGERVEGNASTFYQSPEKTEEFLNSLAFDSLFTEILTDPHAAGTFINGLIPADMMRDPKVKQALADAQTSGPVWPTDSNDPTPTRMATPGVPVITDLPMPADEEADALADAMREQALDEISGLRDPRDGDGNFWPWAHREPTALEKTRMAKPQLVDCMRRKASGWVAPSVSPV